MARVGIVIGMLALFLWACGQTAPTLTTEQAATATAVSAQATFAALPVEIKSATQTAVMERINKDLGATPMP